jgi:Bifunctional DNA primase/polymerase, N-terminal
VLDVDPRYLGDETLAELEGRHGSLPHTARQITGGGGAHILFRAPRDLQPRGSIGTGIDVKWRGFIVVSPSIHPETGRRYAWSSNHHPLAVTIAEPPDWLVDLLTPPVDPSPVGQGRPAIEEGVGWGPKPPYSRAALQRACEAIEMAPVGEQDVTLNQESYSIGRLIGAGLMPRRLAIDCLVHHATLMSNAPGRRRWHEREIQQKVARAVREGELRPREVA